MFSQLAARRSRWYLLAVATAVCITPAARGLTIDLLFDETSYFATNSTARATIEKAAVDISDAITSSLSPLNTWQWTRSNTTSGQTLSLTRNWYHGYVGADGSTVFTNTDLGAHRVQIFVRGADLGGNTLGTGTTGTIDFDGPAPSISVTGTLSKNVLQNQFTMLTNQLSSLAENEFDRGSGPVIRTLTGTSSIDTAAIPGSPDATASYEVRYGPAFGSLALDTSPPSGKTLTQHWHMDHATNVPSGKNDLYSVALHEMLHVLGYGSSETWENHANGTTWTGTEAIAEFGTGLGLVSGSHVAGGIMSRSIESGAVQEAVMDPDLTPGRRKYLTTLDLAFLRDLGYSTIVPNLGPDGDFNNDGSVDLGDYTVWRDNFGGPYTTADYARWKDNFGTVASAAQFAGSTRVPEPDSRLTVLIGLAVSSLFAAVSRRSATGVQ